MEFKYQIKQDEQHEEDNNKLKELRSIQGDLGCKFSSLNSQQIKLYYQKQALIKLNKLFIHLYKHNPHNPYLDFIYKFLDKNDTISNFKKDFFLSLLLTVDFITSLNHIDADDLSINQKIQEQFCKSKNISKEIIVKKDFIKDIVDEFEDNKVMESEGSFTHEYEKWHEKIGYLNQLYMLNLLEKIINFYHKRLFKEDQSKIPLIAMINLDELTMITRKDISEDYFLNFMQDNKDYSKYLNKQRRLERMIDFYQSLNSSEQSKTPLIKMINLDELE